ncbi:MAG: DUF559 domain-containing protein [Proteobacteria bacterium]|nr:DUF559 domain-containing protein [Pseudomonadota bacterium]
MAGSGKSGAYPPPRPSPSRGEGEENDSQQPSDSLQSSPPLRGRVREGGVSPLAQSASKKLRSNMTDAEKKLWRMLRRKQFAGHRFRRQAPIGTYIVDFFCPAAKLIIELDGGQHADRAEHDRRRTDYLTRAGYLVLRFWNNELNENEQGVLTIIGQALGIDETQHAQTH